jgi:hypothetical protein
MPGDQAVIQNPILISETLQELILSDRCVDCVELIIRPLALLVESVDAIRQSSNETELLALFCGERSSLVETRIV